MMVWYKWLVEREEEAGSCLGRRRGAAWGGGGGEVGGGEGARGQRPYLQSTALPMAQRVHQVKKKEK